MQTATAEEPAHAQPRPHDFMNRAGASTSTRPEQSLSPDAVPWLHGLAAARTRRRTRHLSTAHASTNLSDAVNWICSRICRRSMTSPAAPIPCSGDTLGVRRDRHEDRLHTSIRAEATGRSEDATHRPAERRQQRRVGCYLTSATSRRTAGAIFGSRAANLRLAGGRAPRSSSAEVWQERPESRSAAHRTARSDRSSVFTAPDITENDLKMVTLEGTHALDKLTFSSSAFYRSNGRLLSVATPRSPRLRTRQRRAADGVEDEHWITGGGDLCDGRFADADAFRAIQHLRQGVPHRGPHGRRLEHRTLRQPSTMSTRDQKSWGATSSSCPSAILANWNYFVGGLVTSTARRGSRTWSSPIRSRPAAPKV